jgi:hypothetical protein
MLHRLGDIANPNDAGGWINALNNGAQSPQSVAFDIAHSPEALGIVVDGLYLKILKRPSDSDGRSFFVSFLQNGGTVEQAIINMLMSGEYVINFARFNTSFVETLYARILGRAGSTFEVDSWTSAIPLLGRAAVADAFLKSAEFRSDAIEGLYGFPPAPLASVAGVFPNVLHRSMTPAAAEVSGWLNSGGDIFAMEVAFAGSTEFITQASTGMFY